MNSMDAPPLNEEELNAIYNWVDEIPLSRPKKNITRDFADGVLMAEVVAHYYPRIVELHNYSQAHSQQQKLYNWNTLNQKVFKKMGFQLSKNDIDHIINASPDAIERVLKVVQIKIEKYSEQRKQQEQNKQMMQAQNQQNSMNMGMPMPNQGPQNQMYQQDPSYYGQGQGQGQQMGNMGGGQMQGGNVNKLLMEKDQSISELRETVEILELKIKKMEQLVKLKDSKIQTLINKLSQGGQQ